MTIKISSVIEIKSENPRESNYQGTVLATFKARDAAPDSKDLRDYGVRINNTKTGEIEIVDGERILKVIKEGIDITLLKKGAILEVKKSQDSKSYIATVLDVSYDDPSYDNPNEYQIRIKNNRTEKIENIRLFDIIKIISP